VAGDQEQQDRNAIRDASQRKPKTVQEEVEELRLAGKELPPASTCPMREAVPA
jgi:hypothetical protein